MNVYKNKKQRNIKSKENAFEDETKERANHDCVCYNSGVDIDENIVKSAEPIFNDLIPNQIWLKMEYYCHIWATVGQSSFSNLYRWMENN